MKGSNVEKLDLVTVATVFAALLWSPALAAIIAPYAVIIAASVTGAAFGLSRRPPDESRWSAVRFLVRMAFLAILLTITICNLLETYVLHAEAKWLLIPVALGIGWIGDDWSLVFGWLTRRGKTVAGRWAAEREAGK